MLCRFSIIIPWSVFVICFAAFDEAMASPAEGTVLLVPGLNNRPTIMQPLGTVFQDMGFRSTIVRLDGHADDESEWQRVELDGWRHNVDQAYSKLKGYDSHGQFIGVGYSLGALLLALHETECAERCFDKLILFAPAITLRTSSYLVTYITFLRRLQFSLPSLAPEGYRQHDLTPLQAYYATLEGVDRFWYEEHIDRLNRVPTLVFISANDELLDYDALKEWIAARRITSWNMQEVHPAPTEQDVRYHLIIDRVSLGEGEWSRVQEVIRRFVGLGFG